MKLTSTFPGSFDSQTREINFREIIVAPSEKTRIQNHHDSECWSILSGEGLLSSGTQQVRIRAGDYVEFLPFEAHTVKNEGLDDLRFTSYWFVDWDAVADEGIYSVQFGSHLMIETAFPTPNGPLHIGHLSGAYLISDILKRCRELTATDSFTYCGTYGHTNHIDKTAATKSTTYEHLVESCEYAISKDLKSFQIEYDAFLPHAPESDDFEAVKSSFIGLLLKSEFLVERTVGHPYSESTQQFVCESYVAGNCPHCGSSTIGMECENCGLYQDECKLIDPFHSVTKEKLVHRQAERLYLRIDQDMIDEIAVLIYSHNTAASRICYDRLQEYIKCGTLNDIPVSSLRGRGVTVRKNQVLTVVMERALRSFFGLSKYPSATQHLFFCGLDNLCGSGILMPYVLKVLGVPDTQLPIGVINQFCLLDNKKFSTGANHAIWANDFLQEYPSDLVRLYLCHIHSPTSESNFRVEGFADYSNRFTDLLIEVFVNGRELSLHFADGKIEAGPWLKQDIVFYRELNEAMDYCIENYASHSPSVAVQRVAYLLEVISSYITQSYASSQNRNALRTKVALVLHSYRCLAYCLYPIMPILAVQINDCINGQRTLWHADRRAVRVFEITHVDIHSIVDSLCSMKRKISLT